MRYGSLVSALRECRHKDASLSSGRMRGIRRSSRHLSPQIALMSAGHVASTSTMPADQRAVHQRTVHQMSTLPMPADIVDVEAL